jgi:hypothetical protein
VFPKAGQHWIEIPVATHTGIASSATTEKRSCRTQILKSFLEPPDSPESTEAPQGDGGPRRPGRGYHPSPMARLLSVLGFAAMQLAWFACVGGAARGVYWVGPVAILASLVLRLGLRKMFGNVRMWLYLAASAVLGFALDSVFLHQGLFVMPNHSVWSPPWLVALWPSLALCIGKDAELSWLEGRTWLAVAAGAVFGPLAYASGIRMGAVHESANATRSLVLLGLAWAMVLPALSHLRRRLAP